ncbi:MAG: type II toxin-antitoxin system MqsA family antitoxin [Chloroflexi bacterium]|nr:type II toxin-antitoxin system MqsA family antitoxin [Chloroflexota bacterium]
MTNTENAKCYFCGGEAFEERHIRYIYNREGKDLFVPDMPADICLNCGMVYYHGPALLKVEQRFKAIYHNKEQPDRYATMPVMDYA